MCFERSAGGWTCVVKDWRPLCNTMADFRYSPVRPAEANLCFKRALPAVNSNLACL